MNGNRNRNRNRNRILTSLLTWTPDGLFQVERLRSRPRTVTRLIKPTRSKRANQIHKHDDVITQTGSNGVKVL